MVNLLRKLTWDQFENIANSDRLLDSQSLASLSVLIWRRHLNPTGFQLDIIETRHSWQFTILVDNCARIISTIKHFWWLKSFEHILRRCWVRISSESLECLFVLIRHAGSFAIVVHVILTVSRIECVWNRRWRESESEKPYQIKLHTISEHLKSLFTYLLNFTGKLTSLFKSTWTL